MPCLLYTSTTQVEALTNTLAIQCGYTTGTQIETSDLPVVTAEQVTAMAVSYTHLDVYKRQPSDLATAAL